MEQVWTKLLSVSAYNDRDRSSFEIYIFCNIQTFYLFRYYLLGALHVFLKTLNFSYCPELSVLQIYCSVVPDWCSVLDWKFGSGSRRRKPNWLFLQVWNSSSLLANRLRNFCFHMDCYHCCSGNTTNEKVSLSIYRMSNTAGLDGKVFSDITMLG